MCGRIFVHTMVGVELFTLLVLTSVWASAWDLRPGLILYEDVPTEAENELDSVKSPGTEFDGLEIPNFAQFQIEMNLTWIEYICFNGWWIVYEYEDFNAEDAGRIDIITGKNCLNIIRRYGSAQAFSYTPDLKPNLFTMFHEPDFVGSMNQFGTLNFLSMLPNQNDAQGFVLRSGIITGDSSWTLSESKNLSDGICFQPKPDEPRMNAACLLRNVNKIANSSNSGYKLNYIKPGCHSTRNLTLTECIPYGQIRNGIISTLATLPSICSEVAQPNDSVGIDNMKNILDLINLKITYNLSSDEVPDEFSELLHPALTWKTAVLEKMFELFQLSCGPDWVNPEFLNLMKNLYLLRLNEGIEEELEDLGISIDSSEDEDEDLDSVYTAIPIPSVWTLLTSNLESCSSEMISSLDIYSDNKELYVLDTNLERKYISNRTYKDMFGNGTTLADLDPVLETIWLIFSVGFSVCIDGLYSAYTGNRFLQFQFGLEQFFPDTLSTEWFRIRDDPSDLLYDHLFSGFNISETLRNMSLCESAAYASNELDPFWKPSRPFQKPSFNHLMHMS